MAEQSSHVQLNQANISGNGAEIATGRFTVGDINPRIVINASDKLPLIKTERRKFMVYKKKTFYLRLVPDKKSPGRPLMENCNFRSGNVIVSKEYEYEFYDNNTKTMKIEKARMYTIFDSTIELYWWIQTLSEYEKCIYEIIQSGNQNHIWM